MIVPANSGDQIARSAQIRCGHEVQGLDLLSFSSLGHALALRVLTIIRPDFTF
jgi:hypothetical protein